MKGRDVVCISESLVFGKTYCTWCSQSTNGVRCEKKAVNRHFTKTKETDKLSDICKDKVKNICLIKI